MREEDGLRGARVRPGGHDDALPQGRLRAVEEREPEAPQPRPALAIAASVQRRRSSATWSLRERPAWTRRPASPASSISRRSMFRWMSSSASSNRKRPSAISFSIVFSPFWIRASAACGEEPGAPEAAGMRARAGDVLRREPPVEGVRDGELRQRLAGHAGVARAPEGPRAFPPLHEK